MVTGRLAPSPTGRLHLGHARSFLLAWWSARAKGGHIVLRLEDLDHERVERKFTELCKQDLEWLGLDWDGEVRLQSDGFERIRSAAHRLLLQGLAYPCTCTRGELRAQLNAPQQGTAELRYAGHCRARYSDLADAEQRAGRPAALRFRVRDGVVRVHDELVGDQCFNVQSEVGDFAILRRDRIPSYQLAVVVDDAADGVTEVVRGNDLLPSAARQSLLDDALGYADKHWYHVPLVVDACGRRLAKRCDSLGLSTLRELGVDPRAITGWVARNSGMHQVARAIPQELVAEFSWRQVPKQTIVFDDAAHRDLLAAR